MARNYHGEAIEKFPIPPGPIEDDYDNEKDYRQALASYNRVRVLIIAQHKQWVAQEVEADE